MGTLTDTMHIVFTIITVILMLLVIGFSAALLGRRFRMYSIVTVLVLLISGILTGLDSPRLQANLPTPLIGVWERISIGAYMLWMVVLAVVVMRMKEERQKASA